MVHACLIVVQLFCFEEGGFLFLSFFLLIALTHFASCCSCTTPQSNFRFATDASSLKCQFDFQIFHLFIRNFIENVLVFLLTFTQGAAKEAVKPPISVAPNTTTSVTTAASAAAIVTPAPAAPIPVQAAPVRDSRPSYVSVSPAAPALALPPHPAPAAVDTVSPAARTLPSVPARGPVAETLHTPAVSAYVAPAAVARPLVSQSEAPRPLLVSSASAVRAPSVTSKPQSPLAAPGRYQASSPLAGGRSDEPPPLQLDLVRSLVEDAMQDVKQELHRDIRNLHLELLRQTRIQQVQAFPVVVFPSMFNGIRNACLVCVNAYECIILCILCGLFFRMTCGKWLLRNP